MAEPAATIDTKTQEYFRGGKLYEISLQMDLIAALGGNQTDFYMRHLPDRAKREGADTDAKLLDEMQFIAISIGRPDDYLLFNRVYQVQKMFTESKQP